MKLITATSSLEILETANKTNHNDNKRQKRFRDGCQSCKENRLKCDRTKPHCKSCLRKGIDCDYKQKLTWINVENADSRHPSFKNNKRSVSLKSNIESDEYEDDYEDEDDENDMFDTSKEYSQLFDDQKALIGYDDHINDDYGNLGITNQSHIASIIKKVSFNTGGKINLNNTIDFDKRFSSFFRSFPRETLNLFKNQETENIFTHYLLVTCVSLDPLNRSGPQNISEKFFVPFAIYNPATLHGILSISAMQLSVSNPKYKKLAHLHKSLAYKHLYAILQDKDESVGLNAVCAIICQLTIEIIESGIQNWPIHIKALRNIVHERQRQHLQNDQLIWFMYLRIARYDNFATLTTGERPLFKEFKDEDFKYFDPLIRNFDGVFGCPARILFFCSELSYISKSIHDSKLQNDFISISLHLDSLTTSKESLSTRLEDLLSYKSGMITTDEWIQIEEVWKCAMLVHYYHTIEDTFQNDRINIYVERFLKAIELVMLDNDGYFCSNLLFPLLVMSSAVSYKDRKTITNASDHIFQKTNIRAFKEIERVVNEYWELRTSGIITKPNQWWYFAHERQWNVYMA